MSDSVLLPHGGYEHLRSYKVAEAVYDATVVFCDRFIDKRSRTHDQMVQAARSGFAMTSHQRSPPIPLTSMPGRTRPTPRAWPMTRRSAK